VDLPIALSRASCDMRVPSRNQRRTRTACLKQLNARVPVRVPRRRRSACSRLETNSTVSSRTVNVAVYVTLTFDAESLYIKLICERITFILGFCVFPLQRNGLGVAQPTPTYGLVTVTRKGELYAVRSPLSRVATVC